jgi:hypothetical protein
VRDAAQHRRRSRRFRGATAIAAAAGLVVAGIVGVAATSQAATLPAGSYVVSLAPGVDAAALAEAAGVTMVQRYRAAINGFAVKLSSKEATALAADSRVRGVMPDVTFSGAAQTVPPDVGSVQADQPPVSAGDGVTSWTGPAVAIIDSGVNADTDYDLVKAVDCTGTGDPTDGNGHGTGVAGYMAAYDNGYGTVGVAPGAPIYSVRVLDAKNKGTAASILCGVNWVVQNAATYGIKVANMSMYADGADDGDCGYTNDDVLHQAVCSLVAAGVTVVASAGNASKDLAKYVPAAYDEVLTATNVTDYDGRPGGLSAPVCDVTPADDTPAPSSNFAVSAADQAHTLAAPGVCPYTTLKGNRYGYIQSGTSMSSSALSGVVLDCLAEGSCAGRDVAGVRAQIIAQAKASALKGHVFTGDPLHPIAGKYYGYLASTVPTTGATASPTPTATKTPTPTPTPSPGKDVTAPSVSILSPLSGSTVSGTVTVVIQATDDVGVTAVSLSSGSTKLGTATKTGTDTWQATIKSTSYPNGTYIVVAKASDAAGNVGTSMSSTYVIKN